MKTYSLEVLTADQVKKLAANLSSEKNKVIVETAGFIPLEVKFKQFEQNGLINQLRNSDFTSSDYRDMYLHEDFDITPEDDLEEVQEKLEKLQVFRQKMQAEIANRKSGNKVVLTDSDTKPSDTKPKEETKSSEGDLK